MKRWTGGRDMTEKILNTALNPNQSIITGDLAENILNRVFWWQGKINEWLWPVQLNVQAFQIDVTASS